MRACEFVLLVESCVDAVTSPGQPAGFAPKATSSPLLLAVLFSTADLFCGDAGGENTVLVAAERDCSDSWAAGSLGRLFVDSDAYFEAAAARSLGSTTRCTPLPLRLLHQGRFMSLTA
jgi:hypothetical protein